MSFQIIGKGIFEFEIDGKQVGFKFGTEAAGYTEQYAGIEISELFKKIGEKKGEATLSLLHYFYGGGRAYATYKRMDEPSFSQVCDWLDEIGTDKLSKTFQLSLEGPKNPNPEAPTEGQSESLELPTS